MNCRTDILKDFGSRTEAMGLKCSCGDAEQGQILVRVGALLLAV